MSDQDFRDLDVLVLGGGNAALCAAITAREQGASVLMLECSPKCFRGGNSRHTRNMRLAHETQIAPFTGAYPLEEYIEDYARVTGGQGDQELAMLAIQGSLSCLEWAKDHGVRFQPSLSGTLHLGRTNAFFLGGGKALVNAYYAFAERIGVQILYEAEAIDLDIVNGVFRNAMVRMTSGEQVKIAAKTLIAASGGFQSDLEWMRKAWGNAVDNFLIRGTPYDKGLVLKALLDRGAETVADPTQGHMVPIDARSPKFDGGIVTRVDCVTLGVMVNANGERYYDEGEEFWPKRYAIWGRLIAQQPDQISYAFIDSKVFDRFMPSRYPAITGNTIGEVARQFDLPVEKVEALIAEFNRTVQPGKFDHTILDDCKTSGLTPPKTHWAQRLDTPPFYGYPLRTGVTFTYFGVKVNAKSAVLMKTGKVAENIFASGEIMAGNILPKGYVGGFGLTIGNVFGRIAGNQAARAVREGRGTLKEMAHAAK
jgi:tricarballylate dehydrogenase